MTFQELNLLPQLLKAVDELGYIQPSPIQAQAIPPVLKGKDLIGCAQTGTGKTAAFAIPILQRLHGHVSKRHTPIRALVLTPTRELALQIKESFDQYGKYLELRHTVIFGGVGQAPQVEALLQGLSLDSIPLPDDNDSLFAKLLSTTHSFPTLKVKGISLNSYLQCS